MLIAIDNVIPTHVGVNRILLYGSNEGDRYPHTRGGEPRAQELDEILAGVIPTHVGVNRLRYAGAALASALSPHTWG